MPKKSHDDQKTDFSSFMAVLLMTIGVLITVLVSNTLIIISNPENVHITSVVSSSMNIKGEDLGTTPGFANTEKEPSYIDVWRDRLVLYSFTTDDKEAKKKVTGVVVPISDLEEDGNPFEVLMDEIEEKRLTHYVVLLARPRSASVFHRLHKVVRDRGIDVGHELFDDDRQVIYERKH